MTDADPFLRMIRTGRADAIAVLADFLEEQGDPRAGKIRWVADRYGRSVRWALRERKIKRISTMDLVTRSIFWNCLRVLRVMGKAKTVRGEFHKTTGRRRDSPLWLKAADVAVDVCRANRREVVNGDQS